MNVCSSSLFFQCANNDNSWAGMMFPVADPLDLYTNSHHLAIIVHYSVAPCSHLFTTDAPPEDSFSLVLCPKSFVLRLCLYHHFDLFPSYISSILTRWNEVAAGLTSLWGLLKYLEDNGWPQTLTLSKKSKTVPYHPLKRTMRQEIYIWRSELQAFWSTSREILAEKWLQAEYFPWGIVRFGF